MNYKYGYFLDNDLFVDTSKKTKINSLEKCTRITRSSVLLSKNSKSETQLDPKRSVNGKSLLHKIDISQKNDSITDKITIETSIKQDKKSSKKRNMSKTISNIEEKPSKRRNISLSKNIEPSSERVRSLRSRSK
ncbi:hypothetical protein PORY_002822 [Pneumocystis oryctolagi]|uniref:Uncharacterized protein n=1 Tax=Pneumocystis oryctolagi TaxID=42067 RepID=A0ACB7C8N7_9ASCO|nr:hypothetical protein PORY_002822 [Pneumocystis oryctolagi]